MSDPLLVKQQKVKDLFTQKVMNRCKRNELKIVFPDPICDRVIIPELYIINKGNHGIVEVNWEAGEGWCYKLNSEICNTLTLIASNVAKENGTSFVVNQDESDFGEFEVMFGGLSEKK